MPRLWIKNPLAVLAPSDADAGYASAGLVVENDRILECLAAGDTPSVPVDDIFDASEHVLLPGLINTHHHFYQTLTRACPPALNKRLFPWLKTLYPIWARLTPEALTTATELAMVEMLMSGCTTAADHHYLFPEGLESAIDLQADVALRLGMRATLTRGSMTLSVKDGGLPPETVVQSEADILDDSARLAREWHRMDEPGLIEIALAPCSPFSVTQEIMKDTAALARAHDLRLHTHLAETEDENAFCERMFGLRPLDYLESVGWLNERTWLAHGIWFTDDEVKRLGQAGTGICHCPSSNMILASGIARVKELQAAGVPVGLGVDGSASNDHSNLMQEIRQALLIQRLRYEADEFSHLDALYLATEGSAAVLGRDNIGALKPGYKADLALFKLDELRFSGAHDPLAALVNCGAYKADAVMINGDWKVRAGEWLGGDVGALMARHQLAAKTLWP